MYKFWIPKFIQPKECDIRREFLGQPDRQSGHRISNDVLARFCVDGWKNFEITMSVFSDGNTAIDFKS